MSKHEIKFKPMEYVCNGLKNPPLRDRPDVEPVGQGGGQVVQGCRLMSEPMTDERWAEIKEYIRTATVLPCGTIPQELANEVDQLRKELGKKEERIIELEAALRAAEWGTEIHEADGVTIDTCPACGNERGSQHHKDCELGTALKGGGMSDPIICDVCQKKIKPLCSYRSFVMSEEVTTCETCHRIVHDVGCEMRAKYRKRMFRAICRKLFGQNTVRNLNG